jgi:anti-sigma factor RsiW
MTTRPCPQSRLVQPYADDDLPAAEAERFRAHLATCEECASERAAFARVADAIRRAPVWDPGPALTERILDRVVPSRVRRRFVTVVGWAYSAACAVTTFALISWVTRPGTPAWVAGQLSALYLRVLETGLLALHTVIEGWVRLGSGWSLLAALADRMAPLARALALSVTQPAVALSFGAALAGAMLVLWWMRPRARGARLVKGVERVQLLGF